MSENKYTGTQLAHALQVAAASVGQDMPEDVARFIVARLASEANGNTIMQAIRQCGLECSGRILLADIRKRLHASDGRPGVEQAWAIAVMATDESETVAWTPEIAESLREVQPLLDAGDPVAARMAFKEIYQRRVDQTRADCRKPEWTLSLGFDREKRELAASQAVAAGLIAREHVAVLLPPPAEPGSVEAEITALLTGPTSEVKASNSENRKRLEQIMGGLKMKTFGGEDGSVR